MFKSEKIKMMIENEITDMMTEDENAERMA